MIQYRKDLDRLKGIAIIAVILFHLGIVKSGYLGVDVFLVINGFLIVPSLCRKIEDGNFSYFQFMKSRLMRLWPMVALLSIVCLVIGFVGMLPDDFENLGESIVASNLFSENILLSITTKDYWNVSNDYNPLMHLWYVGLIFEFYLLFPLVLLVAKKTAKLAIGGGKFLNTQRVLSTTSVVLFATSLAIYLLPFADYSEKFYYLPYRIFEFLLGGLIGQYQFKLLAKPKLNLCLSTVLVVVLFSSIYYFDIQSIGTDVLKIGGSNIEETRTLIFPKDVMLLLTVLLAGVVIMSGTSINTKSIPALEYIGKRSYSLFIWHQAMVAFYRYFFSTAITPVFLIVFFVVLFLLSELSYRFVEKRLLKLTHSFVITLLVAAFVTLSGGYIYIRAGVVRDVPELGIMKCDAHRGMHAAYVDRVYQYDKDFSQDDKTKVLVVGNSYARDMVNVLLESNYRDKIDVSYVFDWKKCAEERIQKADIIFAFMAKSEVPQKVFDIKKDRCTLWGIGTKNFGQSNGVFYRNRGSADYYEQTAELHPWYKSLNKSWKEEWGDNYIDFEEISLVHNNRVRIFTDDKMYISQDCYHLTEAGARWYARKIDFNNIFR